MNIYIIRFYKYLRNLAILSKQGIFALYITKSRNDPYHIRSDCIKQHNQTKKTKKYMQHITTHSISTKSVTIK